MPYLGDLIPDNPGELAYNEVLNCHHFSFQGKNAPATVSGKTPTERLHNAWLKLQTDVNCCIDSDLDKLSTVKFPGIRQVCVSVCFQVNCGTGTVVTSFNLADLYLVRLNKRKCGPHIFILRSHFCMSIFFMSNLEISRFCMPNIEISILYVSNLEISRFDMQRDLLTRAGEQEIGVVSRSLPDNPGRVGIYMYFGHPGWISQVPSKWFRTIFYVL